jgi:hypothetical protein
MTMKKHLNFTLALFTLICTSAHAQLPSYLPTDGLVGWWPFNGNANDESGNGNDGVVNGATLVEDRNGVLNAAYSFDGVNDFINSPSFAAITGSTNRTYSFWLRCEANSAGGWTISNGPELFSQGGACAAGFHIDAKIINADCSFQGIGVGINCSQRRVQTIINDGIWKHVAVVYDGSGLSATRIFINTEEITSPFCNDGTASWNVPNTSAANGLSFGKRNDNYSNTFLNGSLDDIAIYNRALTEQEIQNLYTATNTGNTVDNGNGAAPLPQGIPYQAAARDANGQPVVDSPVNVRFSLHEGAADGATSYIESHSLTTNSIGLFNTVFGNGTPEQSAFDSINWAATTKFLQVEVDLGNGYVDMGTTQLLSVPYAFRSAQAATLKNAALPIYPDNAAALAGGLVAGEMYRTATGDLKIVY